MLTHPPRMVSVSPEDARSNHDVGKGVPLVLESRRFIVDGLL